MISATIILRGIYATIMWWSQPTYILRARGQSPLVQWGLFYFKFQVQFTENSIMMGCFDDSLATGLCALYFDVSDMKVGGFNANIRDMLSFNYFISWSIAASCYVHGYIHLHYTVSLPACRVPELPLLTYSPLSRLGEKDRDASTHPMPTRQENKVLFCSTEKSTEFHPKTLALYKKLEELPIKGCHRAVSTADVYNFAIIIIS